MVALDCLCLEQDIHDRLLQGYRREEKKTKISCDGNSTDYEKLAEARILAKSLVFPVGVFAPMRCDLR
jgi:hypothetical protein